MGLHYLALTKQALSRRNIKRKGIKDQYLRKNEHNKKKNGDCKENNTKTKEIVYCRPCKKFRLSIEQHIINGKVEVI